jgi:hypothetical protein
MASSAAICGPQLDLFNKSHIKNYRFELFPPRFQIDVLFGASIFISAFSSYQFLWWRVGVRDCHSCAVSVAFPDVNN